MRERYRIAYYREFEYQFVVQRRFLFLFWIDVEQFYDRAQAEKELAARSF